MFVLKIMVITMVNIVSRNLMLWDMGRKSIYIKNGKTKEVYHYNKKINPKTKKSMHPAIKND